MKAHSLLLVACILLFFHENTLAQDYLKSVTTTGTGITTDNSQAWTDIQGASVTIDLGSNTTDTKYVLVTASINMRPAPFPLTNTGAREGNYNIYRSDLITDESGIIKRQIKALSGEPDVQSWGVGTLVHIFDVSGLSGSKTYKLEHSNQGGMGVGRNVESNTRLTAIALSTATNHYELSNDVKRLGDPGSTTTSATYTAVTGLTTDAITLPIDGDIYVAASVNGKADGTAVAEYKLEYSTDDGSSWADLGKPVKRSMINSWDDGIVSLVGLLQDQAASTIALKYKFRVAHKRESGTATVTTHNCNLVAVALVHSGGDYFPSFYSETGTTGVTITGGSTPASTVLSTSLLSNFDIGGIGPNLFVNSQYLVDCSGLEVGDRMRAGNQLKVSGASSEAAEEYYRYIPDNSNFGAGGFIGLMEDLVSNGSYTIAMDHQIAAISGAGGTGDETLKTSEVILTGFQTYDVTGGTSLPIDLIDFQANLITVGKVLLNWRTASEIDNDYFNIERSDNGVDWIEIQKINGSGNSNTINDYSIIDYINQDVEKIYYRLKQTDYNGKFTYPKTVVVKQSQKGNKVIQVYPNPARFELIVVGNFTDKNEIIIYNMLGVNVSDLLIIKSNSEYKYTFDISNLSRGVYYISTRNTSKSIKFIVQ